MGGKFAYGEYELAYESYGEGPRVTVLLHGLLFSRRMHDELARALAERGHRVVMAGPYRYVRHPGYLGHVAATLAAPLMLGSLLGVIAAAPAVLAILLRTALEDRFLIRRLPGYAEYAARTRHRLVPGLW